MRIEGALPLQHIYKSDKISTNNITATNIQPTTDTVEISDEAIRQVNISAFLKDKPYSSYKYDWMKRNQPDKAETFIDGLIGEYDTAKSLPWPNPPLSPRDRDNYAKNLLGYKTAEDVKNGMEQANLLELVWDIQYALHQNPETVNTLKEDDKYWKIVTIGLDYPNGARLNGYEEDFTYYKDIKIDKDTAQIWILPNDSNEWITKEDFTKIFPDYNANSSGFFSEFKLARQASEDTVKKYIENFIAGLSDADKELIRGTNMFGSPAFRNLGIKGLDEFQTTYDNIKGVRKRYSFDYFQGGPAIELTSTPVSSKGMLYDTNPENNMTISNINVTPEMIKAKLSKFGSDIDPKYRTPTRIAPIKNE